MVSEQTKSIKAKMIICQCLSILLSVLPITIYVIKAFIEGGVTQKLGISLLAIVAVVLTIINILFKYSIRSTIWILLLGVYICLENIVPLLIIIAICTILDEFLITPLYKKFRGEFTINKEIDKREGL